MDGPRQTIREVRLLEHYWDPLLGREVVFPTVITVTGPEGASKQEWFMIAQMEWYASHDRTEQEGLLRLELGALGPEGAIDEDVSLYDEEEDSDDT